MGSIYCFIMSVSSDLNTLRERVEVLETELDRSRVDLDDSVDQYDELKARYTALRTECNELKFDNRRLTRKLTEADAQLVSHPIAPQSGEVTTLRQQLAEKDEVIAAQDAKYQSLLNSIKQTFDSLSANKEAIQSRLAAMLEDAAKTLEGPHDGLAQGGPPPDGDAGSKTSATQGATKTPSDHAGSKTSATQGATKASSSHADSKTSGTKRAIKASSSHADSKTSATEGATEPPSKRPATGSKSPDPGQPPSKRPATRSMSPGPRQQPSIVGSETYSGVVTTKRAELLRRGRAGQARVPVSHEDLARKEALQAEQREDIQRGAARSQKPSRSGGFQPSQKALGSSGSIASPAAKPNVTDSQVPKEPWGANFTFEAEPPSAPVARPNVTDSQVPKEPWGPNFVLGAKPPPPPGNAARGGYFSSP